MESIEESAIQWDCYATLDNDNVKWFGLNLFQESGSSPSSCSFTQLQMNIQIAAIHNRVT